MALYQLKCEAISIVMTETLDHPSLRIMKIDSYKGRLTKIGKIPRFGVLQENFGSKWIYWNLKTEMLLNTIEELLKSVGMNENQTSDKHIRNSGRYQSRGHLEKFTRVE